MSTNDYTPEELADLSPEERAAIEDTSVGQDDTPAAGNDDDDIDGTGGDDTGLVFDDVHDDEKPKGDGDDLAVDAGDTPVDVVAPPAKVDPAAEAPVEKPQQAVRLPEDIAEAFKDQLNVLQAKFDDGDITMAELLDARDKINRDIYNAEVEEGAKVAAKEKWQGIQDAFFGANKIYLQDEQRYEDLNVCVKAIAASPAGSGLTDAQVLAKAKAMEETMNGVVNPVVTPPADPGKGVPPKSPAPTNANLGDIPAAAPNETGKVNEFAYMDKLSGTAYEDALEKMPEATRDRFLKG